MAEVLGNRAGGLAGSMRADASAQTHLQPSSESAETERPSSRGAGHNGKVTIGQDPFEESRRQRRSGDPRLSESDKEILCRISTGDLADDFAASLAAISDADPLLGGGPPPDGD